MNKWKIHYQEGQYAVTKIELKDGVEKSCGTANPGSTFYNVMGWVLDQAHLTDLVEINGEIFSIHGSIGNA